MYQNILVPLDGSDNAYMALKHAVKLAQTFKSKLFLVNVIDITRLNAYSPAAYGGTLYTNLLKVAKIIVRTFWIVVSKWLRQHKSNPYQFKLIVHQKLALQLIFPKICD